MLVTLRRAIQRVRCPRCLSAHTIRTKRDGVEVVECEVCEAVTPLDTSRIPGVPVGGGLVLCAHWNKTTCGGIVCPCSMRSY